MKRAKDLQKEIISSTWKERWIYIKRSKYRYDEHLNCIKSISRECGIYIKREQDLHKEIMRSRRREHDIYKK